MKDALILSASYFYEERRYERLLSLIMAIKDGFIGHDVFKKIAGLNDTEGYLTVTWRQTLDSNVTEEDMEYVKNLWGAMFSEDSIEHKIYYEAKEAK